MGWRYCRGYTASSQTSGSGSCASTCSSERRTVLIDTGLAGTPEEVIVPYLEEIGLGVEDVDEVIISHSDVDHCGGNRALKEMNPSLRFSCGEADRAWVESTGRIMAEIYLWSEPYGFGPDEESKDWIRTELGGDSPVDVGLRGGETLRLGPTGGSSSCTSRATRRATSASGMRRTTRPSS